MRSSIACIRCRRSKVKCVNNGVGTTCRSCENTGRDCQYPPSNPGGGGGRRRDSIPGRDGHAGGEGERRQRVKKSHHGYSINSSSGLRESPRPLLDALDPRLLTARVWQELFDIFQVHYSADLPFLHPPSFLKPLRQASLQSQLNGVFSEETMVKPPASAEFLLAFLALTARFHLKLVTHHSPPTSSRSSNPLIASEYYAAAANERMASFWTDHRTHDIERTQAMLMLGLHEWGMCRGAKAWLTVGTAIRAAQAMGLQYEYDLDDEPMSRSMALNGDVSKILSGSSRRPSETGNVAEDAFTQQEIRRRTFWSCYIMDRYLSSGKYRPQMLHASELRIQLPASERSFLFGEKVRTLMLADGDKTISGASRADIRNQRQQSVLLGATGTPERSAASSTKGMAAQANEDEKVRLEVGSDEGLVSCYIKILEIYGKIIKWSCSGGRRTELHPPWDDRSEFYKLSQQCQDFKAGLPRQHTLTPQNTQAHISQKTSTSYTLLHTVYLLCQIVLHREYVPFVPLRCSKPSGPLDEPIFSPSKYNIPPGYWENSARECFRSARDIIGLVRTCQEWGALVETPIVGFAIYTVAFNGVYCTSFPWMDPDGYMCTRWDPETRTHLERPSESKGLEAARKALETIGQMRFKLHMADGWFKTINRMHSYYSKIKRDYRRSTQLTESGTESDSTYGARRLSLREGGPGGGLDDFKILERTLQDFGALEDEDVEMADAQQPSERPLETIYDEHHSQEAAVKSEEAGEKYHTAHAGPEPQRQEGGAWSAINTSSGVSNSRQPSISTPSSGQFRSYDSYQPQPSQTSQPLSAQSHSHPQQLPTPSAHTPSYHNFRPASADTQGSGPPRSLTSPAAHSATASTPSQASPAYEHQHSYSGWTPQNSTTYAMHAPPPPNTSLPGANGVSRTDYQQSGHHHHHGLPSSMHLASAQSSYSSPSQPNNQPQQFQAQATPRGLEQQDWKGDEWLSHVNTRLGGEDVVQFVEGGDIAQWASLANSNHDYTGSWLGMIWQTNSRH